MEGRINLNACVRQLARHALEDSSKTRSFPSLLFIIRKQLAKCNSAMRSISA